MQRPDQAILSNLIQATEQSALTESGSTSSGESDTLEALPVATALTNDEHPASARVDDGLGVAAAASSAVSSTTAVTGNDAVAVGSAISVAEHNINIQRLISFKKIYNTSIPVAEQILIFNIPYHKNLEHINVIKEICEAIELYHPRHRELFTKYRKFFTMQSCNIVNIGIIIGRADKQELFARAQSFSVKEIDLLSGLALGEHTATLQNILQKNPTKAISSSDALEYIMQFAVLSGNLDIVKIIIENFIISVKSNKKNFIRVIRQMIQFAVVQNNLAIMNYLLTKINDSTDPSLKYQIYVANSFHTLVTTALQYKSDTILHDILDSNIRRCYIDELRLNLIAASRNDLLRKLNAKFQNQKPKAVTAPTAMAPERGQEFRQLYHELKQENAKLKQDATTIKQELHDLRVKYILAEHKNNILQAKNMKLKLIQQKQQAELNRQANIIGSLTGAQQAWLLNYTQDTNTLWGYNEGHIEALSPLNAQQSEAVRGPAADARQAGAAAPAAASPAAPTTSGFRQVRSAVADPAATGHVLPRQVFGPPTPDADEFNDVALEPHQTATPSIVRPKARKPAGQQDLTGAAAAAAAVEPAAQVAQAPVLLLARSSEKSPLQEGRSAKRRRSLP